MEKSNYYFGSMPLNDDQYSQLLQIKTMAEAGIPDNVLMPYFQEIIGGNLGSKSDKEQEAMSREANLLQLYQLRDELGLDTKGLEQALGINKKPSKLDVSQYATPEALQKAVNSYELMGENVDPLYKKIVEFAQYNPSYTDRINSGYAQFRTKSLASNPLKALAMMSPLAMIQEAGISNEFKDYLKKQKYGKDYDMLNQYMSNFE